jgi:hypothetical protein
MDVVLDQKEGMKMATYKGIGDLLGSEETGENENVLCGLADRMNAALKAAKRGNANYHRASDRVYVNNQSGKKAGYIEMADGKAFYREVASPDLISIFKTARKEQKGSAK